LLITNVLIRIIGAGEAKSVGRLFGKSDETMRFRDPGIVALLAASILQTLKLPKRHSSDMKQYRKKVLRCQCRELEKFLRFRKSAEAQTQADRLGIGDLCRFSWADQRKNGKMGDLERNIFVAEHTMPVAVLVEQLLSLASPTLVSVQSVISKAEVSWITRTEKDRLDKAKRRNKNADPAQLYFNARIVLCDELPD
jgi:hypothetical protein